MTYVLWIVQVLLAALFLFAGVMKLILPLDKMTGPVPVPGLFLRIRPGPTPLAAAGLVIIMLGATVLNLRGGDLFSTGVTVVVGVLAAFVAYGRWKIAPLRGSSPAASTLRTSASR